MLVTSGGIWVVCDDALLLAELKTAPQTPLTATEHGMANFLGWLVNTGRNRVTFATPAPPILLRKEKSRGESCATSSANFFGASSD